MLSRWTLLLQILHDRLKQSTGFAVEAVFLSVHFDIQLHLPAQKRFLPVGEIDQAVAADVKQQGIDFLDNLPAEFIAYRICWTCICFTIRQDFPAW